MEKLIKSIVMAGIGFAIGCLVSYCLGDGIEIPVAILFAGLPSGWSFIGRHFGHSIVFGNIIFAVIFYAVKLAAALVIGWIVLFVDVIRGLYEVLSRSAEPAQ